MTLREQMNKDLTFNQQYPTYQDFETKVVTPSKLLVPTDTEIWNDANNFIVDEGLYQLLSNHYGTRVLKFGADSDRFFINSYLPSKVKLWASTLPFISNELAQLKDAVKRGGIETTSIDRNTTNTPDLTTKNTTTGSTFETETPNLTDKIQIDGTDTVTMTPNLTDKVEVEGTDTTTTTPNLTSTTDKAVSVSPTDSKGNANASISANDNISEKNLETETKSGTNKDEIIRANTETTTKSGNNKDETIRSNTETTTKSGTNDIQSGNENESTSIHSGIDEYQTISTMEKDVQDIYKNAMAVINGKLTLKTDLFISQFANLFILAMSNLQVCDSGLHSHNTWGYDPLAPYIALFNDFKVIAKNGTNYQWVFANGNVGLDIQDGTGNDIFKDGFKVQEVAYQPVLDATKHITSLTSTVNTNKTSIGTNTTGISTNKTSIGTNSESINKLLTSINTKADLDLSNVATFKAALSAEPNNSLSIDSKGKLFGVGGGSGSTTKQTVYSFNKAINKAGTDVTIINDDTALTQTFNAKGGKGENVTVDAVFATLNPIDFDKINVSPDAITEDGTNININTSTDFAASTVTLTYSDKTTQVVNVTTNNTDTPIKGNPLDITSISFGLKTAAIVATPTITVTFKSLPTNDKFSWSDWSTDSKDQSILTSLKSTNSFKVSTKGETITLTAPTDKELISIINTGGTAPTRKQSYDNGKQNNVAGTNVTIINDDKAMTQTFSASGGSGGGKDWVKIADQSDAPYSNNNYTFNSNTPNGIFKLEFFTTPSTIPTGFVCFNFILTTNDIVVVVPAVLVSHGSGSIKDVYYIKLTSSEGILTIEAITLADGTGAFDGTQTFTLYEWK